MTEEYKPIACALYDVLEASALRRVPVRLMIDGQPHEVLVQDVFARGPEEFMVARYPAGNEATFRLDRIESITEIATGKTYISDKC